MANYNTNARNMFPMGFMHGIQLGNKTHSNRRKKTKI